MKKLKDQYSSFPLIATLAIGFLILFTSQTPDNNKTNKHKSSFITGKASFYANMLQGSNTSSGEAYDKYDFTCAHRTFPFNTLLSVTNIANGKTAIVRVNDRGPYSKGRIIDLSKAAARKLGMLPDGVAKVKIREVALFDFFPLNDSLLHKGDVFDTRGNKQKLCSHNIHVWNTQDLKHALYMATDMENEYCLDSIFIKVAGKEDERYYALYIPDIGGKEEADKLIAVLKQDGFSLSKYEKK